MKKYFRINLYLAAVFAGLFTAFTAMAQTSPRERILFNAGWSFQKNDPANIVEKDAKGKIKSTLDYQNIKQWFCANGTDLVLPSDSIQATKRPDGNLGNDITYAQSDFDDSGWRKLNLPHDWGIEGDFSYDLPGNTGKLPWAGTGWYRKHFMVPATDKNKCTYIDIDGAMAYPMVWVNGKYVGGWAYGYTSFRLDLSPYLKYGASNVIAIRVSNPENSSRWYPGSGIYRNVWLVKTKPVHVSQWGTYITTPQISKALANVDLKVTVENNSDKAASVKLVTSVYETGVDGNKTGNAISTFKSVLVNLAPRDKPMIATEATINNPKLWTLAKPALYTAVTRIEQNGQVLDTYETRFGIRTIKFDEAKGFFLNGELVKLNGVCNHHDLGALGTAFNTRAAERQLEIMKELGVNALRTSHNPPAPELLDLCDRMGILVMDESFDCWERGKTPNDYSLLFKDWHARDTRAQLRRDRNHPSIVLWSSGNEIPDISYNKKAPAISNNLSAIIRAEDITRPITVAGINGQKGSLSGFRNSIDVIGWNYDPNLYGKAQQDNTGWGMLGSETSSAVSSRGVYYFPVTNSKNQGKGLFQVSSYDLYAPNWGTTPDDEFKNLDQHPNIYGEFVWTGFDYIGEPTPFNNDITNLLNFHDPVERAKAEKELQEIGKVRTPSRSSYFGIVDLAGFKKDRFYMYQSRWRPDLPMAHILPHWNWPEMTGQIVPVHVYTSGDEAELFLNGKSLGRKKKEPYQYRLRWDSVIYQPGTVQVVAYKNGKKWAEDVVKTTGKPVQLKLQADRKTIRAAGGDDLSFITVSVTDQNGLTVPQANNLLKFTISGPGEIAGTDNGDATSFESFLGKQHKAFNGMALVIVRSKAGSPGKITLTATADGLTSGKVDVLTK